MCGGTFFLWNGAVVSLLHWLNLMNNDSRVFKLIDIATISMVLVFISKRLKMFNKHFACSIVFDKQIYTLSRMKQMKMVLRENISFNFHF